jgi:hypothetical protein
VPVAFTGQLAGTGDPVSPGQRRRGVGAFHDIVVGFCPGRVAGHSALLAEGAEVLAPRQEFVDVGLVSGVKDDAVAGRVKNSVHGERELHHAKVWSEVAARLGDIGDQEIPDLRSQLVQLLFGQLVQVLRIPDGVQDSQ